MRRAAAAFLLSAAAAMPAGAQTCGLCAREIVTNSELAQCLLQRYPALSSRAEGAIAVDLSDCERGRGIIEALPRAGVVVDEPDLRFMLSRDQLDCLKRKLEAPGVVLDPTVRIDLGVCG